MFGSEIDILKSIEGIRTDFLNVLFEFITMFGEDLLMVLVIAILYFAIDKKLGQKTFFLSMFSLGINGVIKNLAKVPRPFTRGISSVREGTATGYSFPSGHTQAFTSWSSVVAMHYKKKALTAVCAVMILLVGFSRMYLGAHYLSDVVAAILLGVLFGVVGSMVYDRIENKLMLYSVAAAVLLPFVVWFVISPNELYEDFFKFYGMLAAFIPSYIMEKKFPLTFDVPVWKKVVRVLVALVLALGLKEGLKVFYIDSNIAVNLIVDMVRYFVMILVCMGVCPIVFKKIKL